MAAFPEVRESQVRAVTVENTASWDSMGKLTLGALIEEEFGVSIEDAVLARLQSYKAVRDEIGTRLQGR